LQPNCAASVSRTQSAAISIDVSALRRSRNVVMVTISPLPHSSTWYSRKPSMSWTVSAKSVSTRCSRSSIDPDLNR
jgi:hypothetical protein